MRIVFALVCLFACGRPAPKQPPSNAVEAPPPVEVEVEEPSPCKRYHELFSKAEACTALSEDQHRDLQQWETDMEASVSESGMDGSSPVDEEKLCEEAADHIIKVAKQPCGL